MHLQSFTSSCIENAPEIHTHTNKESPESIFMTYCLDDILNNNIEVEELMGLNTRSIIDCPYNPHIPLTRDLSHLCCADNMCDYSARDQLARPSSISRDDGSYCKHNKISNIKKQGGYLETQLFDHHYDQYGIGDSLLKIDENTGWWNSDTIISPMEIQNTLDTSKTGINTIQVQDKSLCDPPHFPESFSERHEIGSISLQPLIIGHKNTSESMQNCPMTDISQVMAAKRDRDRLHQIDPLLLEDSDPRTPSKARNTLASETDDVMKIPVTDSSVMEGSWSGTGAHLPSENLEGQAQRFKKLRKTCGDQSEPSDQMKPCVNRNSEERPDNVETPLNEISVTVEEFRGCENFDRRYFSKILQDVGLRHLSRFRELNLEISEWFQIMGKTIIEGSQAEPHHVLCQQVSQAMARAKNALLTGLLGSLRIFYHMRPENLELEHLFEEAWIFFKERFRGWSDVSLVIEDRESYSHYAQTYNFCVMDNPKESMGQMQYLIHLQQRQSLPYRIIRGLYDEWVKTKEGKAAVDKYDSDIQESFIEQLTHVKSNSIDEDFLFKVCLHDSEFMSVFLKTEMGRKQKVKSSDSESKSKTKELGKFLVEVAMAHKEGKIDQLHNDVREFFEGLRTYLENSRAQKMGYIDRQSSKMIKNSIINAQMVTFGFFGSLISLNPGRIKLQTLENILQNGWQFLERNFSQWKKFDSQTNVGEDIFNPFQKVNAYKVRWYEPLQMFQYLLGHGRKNGVPLRCINFLVDSWHAALLDQVDTGINLGFHIPNLQKGPLSEKIKLSRRNEKVKNTQILHFSETGNIENKDIEL